MELKDAIYKILDGNCMIFTGSGFSLGATNIKQENSGMLKAYELANYLYDECGYNIQDGNLTNASNLYQKKFGPHKLIELLKQEYTVRSISPDQEYIGSLPWLRIYTTNYDKIVELSYEKNKKYLTPVTLSCRINDYKDKSKLCLHLNGYIERLTPETLNTEFKLTAGSYLADNFSKNEWIEFFKNDLKICDAIFFVGFSMIYDLDIARIVYASQELHNKCFFIVSDNENAVNLDLLKDFGHPCPIGLSGFVDLSRSALSSHISKAKVLMPILCFSRPEIRNTAPQIQDQDRHALLVKGNLNTHILDYSLLFPERYEYFLYRDKLNNVMEDIDNGQSNILVQSDLGNGKTLFLHAVAILLSRKGYEVFFYEKYRTTAEREIETICRQDNKKTVLIFDDYHDVHKLIEIFQRFRSDQILITSERTQIFQTIFDNVEDTIGEYQVYDINRLTPKETTAFNLMLKHYGLWGVWAGRSDEARYKYIQNTCNNHISNVILALLDSSILGKKIKTIVDEIKSRKGFFHALILILISKSFSFRLEIDEVVELLNDKSLNNPSFKTNPVINEFVNFYDDQIIMRSSVFAQYILTKITDPELVIDTLIMIAKSLDTKFRSHSPSRQKFTVIINFRLLQKSINMENSAWKTNIFRYYESIRNLDFCADNPQFWLQYAIAELSDYNYVIAGQFFKTAYSCAENIPGYDTYQIDNHYARFLLENEVEYGNPTTCIKAFDEAHQILITPHKGDELKHYPYRVAQGYYTFYQKFYNQLQQHEKNRFMSSCQKMYDKVLKYLRTPGATRKNHVNKTKDMLEQILVMK